MKNKSVLLLVTLSALLSACNSNEQSNEQVSDQTEEQSTEEVSEVESTNEGDFNPDALDEHVAELEPVNIADLPLASDQLLIHGSTVDEPIDQTDGVLTYLDFVSVEGEEVTVGYSSVNEADLDSAVIGSGDFDETIETYTLDDFNVTEDQLEVLTTGETFSFTHDGTTITDEFGNTYQLYDETVDDFLIE